MNFRGTKYGTVRFEVRYFQGESVRLFFRDNSTVFASSKYGKLVQSYRTASLGSPAVNGMAVHRALQTYGLEANLKNVAKYLLMMGFFDLSSGEVFCGHSNALTGGHLRFCYGLTAYCCGFMDSQCCWDSIWKVWWFWVVVLVVLGALFSCLGYFCTCVSEERYNSGRVSPFASIRDSLRRRWSNGSSVDDERWKVYSDRSVLLPPYYPATNTIAVSDTATHSAYPDPPPPYVEEVTTASETTTLLPGTTTTPSSVMTTPATVHPIPANVTTVTQPMPNR